MARAVKALVLSLATHGALGVRVDLDADDRQSTRGSAKSNVSACAAVSQGLLQVHAQCRESLGKPSTLGRFPNLHAGWCDEQLREIAHHHCDSAEKDRLQAASFVETNFQRVTSLVGSSQEALAAEGAWEDCSGELHASSCTVCESRHAGARERLPTTHACEWKAGACVRSQRARPLPFGEAARGCGEDPALVSGFSELGHEVASNRSRSGRKKVALLVGIKYSGSELLPGTFSDIKNMFNLLVKKKGFEASNIFVLYDHGNWRDFMDSAGNSAQVLPGRFHFRSNQAHDEWDGYAASFWEMANWIVAVHKLSAGDHFHFYFSGHGTQTRPGSAPDELDGRDEWLVTANHDKITDDDFYDFLTQFPVGVTVTAIADACHSEGFSDLPFNYMPGSAKDGWLAPRFQAQREWCTDWYQARRALPRARIIFISGSQNEQTSVDLGNVYGGALTWYLKSNWDKDSEGTKTRWNIRHNIAYALGMSKDNNGGGGWERGSENSLYNRYKALSKFFKKEGFSQEPNICAFPSITDTEDFDPFSPPDAPYGDLHYDIDYYPFVGGPKPRNAVMKVPPLCTHGGRAEKAAHATQRASTHDEAFAFDVLQQLQVAPEAYEQGGPWEGWVAPFEVHLPPAQGLSGIFLSKRARDVVRYVAPGSAGERAGLRVGDIIKSINGWRLHMIQHAERERALSKGGPLQVCGTRG